MRKLSIILNSILLAVFLASTVYAEGDMKRLLSRQDEISSSIFLGQDGLTRLDMIDYFEAGSDKFSKDDLFGAPIRITQLEDRHVRFEGIYPSRIDFYLVTPGTDSLSVAVNYMPIDNGDEFVIVENFKDGKEVSFEMPQYTDWLTKDALNVFSEEELIAAVPFVSVTADVNTDNGIITLKNNTINTPGLDPSIVAVFKPELSYIWKGKKYVLRK